MIPAYIIAYNHLTYVKQMVEQCPRFSLEPIIVDNHSDYPPLLDWYQHCPYRVIRQYWNSGERTVWEQNVLLPPDLHRKYFGTDYYVVTDPDMDLNRCPDDLIPVLIEGLRRYPDRVKCGTSLEINDLPEVSAYGTRQGVSSTEAYYWTHRLDERYFDATIDTTFALYSIHTKYIPKGLGCWDWNWLSLRTDRPYVARHLPWHKATLTDEDRYYHCRNPLTNTTWFILHNEKIKHL